MRTQKYLRFLDEKRSNQVDRGGFFLVGAVPRNRSFAVPQLVRHVALHDGEVRAALEQRSNIVRGSI